MALEDVERTIRIYNRILERQLANAPRREFKHNKVEKKVADTKKKAKRKQKEKSQRRNRRKK